jgi:hypothetical protein
VPHCILVGQQVAAQPCLCQEVAELRAAHTTCGEAGSKEGSVGVCYICWSQVRVLCGLTDAADAHLKAECGVRQAVQQRLHLCVQGQMGQCVQASQGSTCPIAPAAHTCGLLS